MLRIIGGIVAGLAAVFATTLILELLAHQIFPIPGEGQPLPIGIQLFVVFAWFTASVVGGVLAGRIAGARWAVWVIAIFCAASGVATVLMFPHPVWMQIASVVAPLIGGFIANHLVAPRAAGAASASLGSDAEV
jgi:uncharacterized membrane protein